MKVDIEPGVRNDSLQYRNQLWVQFTPDMSTGSEEDTLTFINIPLLVNYVQIICVLMLIILQKHRYLGCKFKAKFNLPRTGDCSLKFHL